MPYEVAFGPDIAGDIAAGAYDIVEISGAATSWHNPPGPTSPARIHHDGRRLVLPLGPGSTADDTYSTTEVASAPRFDQPHLDRELAHGSPRVVVPGREAFFDDVVFSPEFADRRGASETVTAGLTFQSWRGISEGVENATARGERPRYMAAALTYVGGPGIVPAFLSRSPRRRVLVAVVIDFNVGLQWVRPLPDLDITTPHDYVIRWLPGRDMHFLVDGEVVVAFEDGRSRIGLMKVYPSFRAGTDWVGHRHLTADPCHIDAWINCSRTGNAPDVYPGRRFRRDLWLALGGFGVRPIPSLA